LCDGLLEPRVGAESFSVGADLIGKRQHEGVAERIGQYSEPLERLNRSRDVLRRIEGRASGAGEQGDTERLPPGRAVRSVARDLPGDLPCLLDEAGLQERSRETGTVERALRGGLDQRLGPPDGAISLAGLEQSAHLRVEAHPSVVAASKFVVCAAEGG